MMDYELVDELTGKVIDINNPFVIRQIKIDQKICLFSKGKLKTDDELKLLRVIKREKNKNAN